MLWRVAPYRGEPRLSYYQYRRGILWEGSLSIEKSVTSLFTSCVLPFWALSPEPTHRFVTPPTWGLSLWQASTPHLSPARTCWRHANGPFASHLAKAATERMRKPGGCAACFARFEVTTASLFVDRCTRGRTSGPARLNRLAFGERPPTSSWLTPPSCWPKLTGSSRPVRGGEPLGRSGGPAVRAYALEAGSLFDWRRSSCSTVKSATRAS